MLTSPEPSASSNFFCASGGFKIQPKLPNVTKGHEMNTYYWENDAYRLA